MTDKSLNLRPPAYTLYLLPGFTKGSDVDFKPIMAQVLEAYCVRYDVVFDPLKAMKLCRGNANPSSSGCVALNNRTGEAFYDFLEFCKDVKDTQSLPMISISL